MGIVNMEKNATLNMRIKFALKAIVLYFLVIIGILGYANGSKRMYCVKGAVKYCLVRRTTADSAFLKKFGSKHNLRLKKFFVQKNFSFKIFWSQKNILAPKNF